MTATDLSAVAATDGYPAPTPVGPRARPRVRPVPVPRPGTTATADGPAHLPPVRLADRLTVLRAADTGWRDDEPSTCAELPDPTLLARSLAAGLVEVALNARSVATLARWLAPGVLAELRDRATMASSAPPRSRRSPRVRRLVVCRLDTAVEVAAAVDDSVRTRAVAMRLEPHRGAWKVTAVEFG